MTGVEGARYASSCLAIDIGASKVELGVVSPGGDVQRRERIEVADHPSDLFEKIGETAVRIKSASGVSLVGVGCAGPMTLRGATVSPLNIPAWRDFPLRASLRALLGDDVYVDGDARALALAEGRFGAATRDESYLSMVVSSGVGGGIVIDGRLLDGESGNAGHIGHLNVVPNGNLCSCGAFGCLEAEASGWAIEVSTGRPANEADHATRTRTAELVGRAVGTLCSVLDVNRCYIGGSVALGFGEEFFVIANKAARTMATMHYSQSLEIRPSALGMNGPLVGAAMVAWREIP
jgi:glucokinase